MHHCDHDIFFNNRPRPDWHGVPEWDKRDPRAWCPHPVGCVHYYFPRLKRCLPHDGCHHHPHFKEPHHLSVEHLKVIPVPHIRGNVHKSYNTVVAPDNVVLSIDANIINTIELNIVRTNGTETTIIEKNKRYCVYFVKNAELLKIEGIVTGIFNTLNTSSFTGLLVDEESNITTLNIEIDYSELNKSQSEIIPVNCIRRIEPLTERDGSFEITTNNPSIDINVTKEELKNKVLTITTSINIDKLGDNGNGWRPIVLRSGKENLPIGLTIRRMDGQYRSCFSLHDIDIEDTLCPLVPGDNIVTFIIDYNTSKITFIVNNEYIQFDASGFIEVGNEKGYTHFDIPYIDNIKFCYLDNSIYIVGDIKYEITESEETPISKILNIDDYDGSITAALEAADDNDIIIGNGTSVTVEEGLEITKPVSLTKFRFIDTTISYNCKGNVFIAGNIFESTEADHQLNININGKSVIANNEFIGKTTLVVDYESEDKFEPIPDVKIISNIFNIIDEFNAIQLLGSAECAIIDINNNAFSSAITPVKIANKYLHKCKYIFKDNSFVYLDISTIENPGFIVFEPLNEELSLSEIYVSIINLKYETTNLVENTEGNTRIWYILDSLSDPNVTLVV